jgi:hypothetical protein
MQHYVLQQRASAGQVARHCPAVEERTGRYVALKNAPIHV